MIVGVCRLIANHLHLAFFRKHTRSQGPSLHRHYPASTVILPCPTPACAAARSDVEAAALAPSGSPPITRATFPTCRAHYKKTSGAHRNTAQSDPSRANKFSHFLTKRVRPGSDRLLCGAGAFARCGADWPRVKAKAVTPANHD